MADLLWSIACQAKKKNPPKGQPEREIFFDAVSCITRTETETGAKKEAEGFGKKYLQSRCPILRGWDPTTYEVKAALINKNLYQIKDFPEGTIEDIRGLVKAWWVTAKSKLEGFPAWAIHSCRLELASSAFRIDNANIMSSPWLSQDPQGLEKIVQDTLRELTAEPVEAETHRMAS